MGPQFFAGLDWEALAKRELKPPYKPVQGKDPLANFDVSFTGMEVENTPVDEAAIADLDQQLFADFDFVAGAAAPSDDTSVRPAVPVFVAVASVFRSGWPPVFRDRGAGDAVWCRMHR
jgi:hypothetical protein